MSFALVTDSTCDISRPAAEKLGIQLLPLRVRVGSESYYDWAEIDADAVYERQQAGEQLSTHPVSQERFERVYSKLLEQHDFIVSIHVSSFLSPTVQHARKAVANLKAGARILVIDSGLASMALAEAVLQAREVLLAGEDADAAQLAVKRVRTEGMFELTVPRLEPLRESGRLSGGAAILGNMLGLRPVLGLEEGRLVMKRRVKAERSLQDMIGQLEQHFGQTPLSVSVVHAGNDPEKLQTLREGIEGSRLNVVRRRVQLMGAVIGTHVGAGTYGIGGVPVAPADAPHDEAHGIRIGRH